MHGKIWQPLFTEAAEWRRCTLWDMHCHFWSWDLACPRWYLSVFFHLNLFFACLSLMNVRKYFSSYDLTRFIDRFCVMQGILSAYKAREIFCELKKKMIFIFLIFFTKILHFSVKENASSEHQRRIRKRKKTNWSFNLSQTSVCTCETQ